MLYKVCDKMFRLEVFFDEMIEKIDRASILLDETKIRVRRTKMSVES